MVSTLGQAMYITTLGEHIGSGKAHWASTLTHWVSALGWNNGSGKAHWVSTLTHWVSALGWHIGSGKAHWAINVKLGQYHTSTLLA